MSAGWRSVAVSDGLAGRLLTETDLAGRLDHAGLDAVVLGLGRLDPRSPEEHHLDPTSLAAVLSPRLPGTRLLIAAAGHREHPWNLARAVASLQTVLPAGSGLVLGSRDHTVAGGRPGARAWDVRDLAEPVDIGPEATAETGVVARKLWDGYPYDAILADPASGGYLDLERVRASDHHGGYDVAGPLPVPTRGRPLLSLFASDDVPGDVPSAFDSVTVPLELAGEIDAETSGGLPLIAYVRDPDRLAEAGRDGRWRGVQALATDDRTLHAALAALGRG
ncbi:hypothetical protein DP939_14605 [Spongiactinospora rosea]|uniref:Luciferase-like monooxygenase n=1 Tax=Spongiactinospora rosea TaxID=2248750 RepID=A0A366LZ13_9ACTN|nr:hypothetical protein [Spongiactinospora rosea]RBQ19175.1 hypothetical protein DP939_14605 [Spongiactinospora rosea]